jgi:hypothetical protein
MTDTPRHCQKPAACEGRNPGKHCRRCWNHAMHNDPEIQARRLANMRARCATPEFRENVSAGMKARYTDPAAREKTSAALRRTFADPVKRAACIDRAIENGRKSWPKTQTPEAAVKRAKTLRAHHLAWCPPEYWNLNRQLKVQGFKLAERKAIIAQQAEHDSPAAVAMREARDTIARITAEMDAKVAREKAQAY